MKARMAWGAGVVLTMASLLSWTMSARADDMPAVKLAVCDPIKILTQMQEYKDVMAKMKQDGDTLNNQVQVKKGQLQTEQDEIKLLLPTSDEFEKKIEKLTEDSADVQAWMQAMQLNFARKQRIANKQLFDKVLKGIGDVAQAQGITLVMNCAHPDFPADSDKMDMNAFFQTVLLHTSLFNDPKLDITQQVIIAMDKTYSTSH
ncbi:MAG: OmpH family outer membrane protein [Tepidisphaeraceae bacterium]